MTEPRLTAVHCQTHQQWAHEHQNWTKKEWKKALWSFELLGNPVSCCHGVYLASKFPRSQPREAPVLDKQVRSTEAPPCTLHYSKDLLLTSWC